VRLLKCFLAIFVLIPLCIICTRTALVALFDSLPGMLNWQRPWFLCFVAGIALWSVVFFLLPRPMWLYVLGHEVTHAFWAWLFGGRIMELKVSSQGGLVRTNKSNFFIVLAPYFFPFYCFVVLVLWFVVGLFFPLDAYLPVMFFVLGVAYGFHILFTMTVIPMVQSDITSQGWLFSLSIIYLLNLLPLGIFVLAIVPGTDWASLPVLLWESIVWFVQLCDLAVVLAAKLVAGSAN